MPNTPDGEHDGSTDTGATGGTTGGDALEERLGYRFRDRALRREALTHRSYAYESDNPDDIANERLEFLGDALLGFVSAELVFARAPEADEGRLTAIRAALIRTSTLARFALQLGLDAQLRVGRGHTPAGMGERIWASTFEALVGAVYRDGGLAAARDVVLPLLAAELERALAGDQLKDAKSILQDRAQTQLGRTPTYRTVATEGPSHAPRFVVEVVIGEYVAGVGEGPNKRQAEQAAARRALEDPGWATQSTTRD